MLPTIPTTSIILILGLFFAVAVIIIGTVWTFAIRAAVKAKQKAAEAEQRQIEIAESLRKIAESQNN